MRLTFSNNIITHNNIFFLLGMPENSDKGVSLAVIPDRAQGGSSLADGQLELMVIIKKMSYFKFVLTHFFN